MASSKKQSKVTFPGSECGLNDQLYARRIVELSFCRLSIFLLAGGSESRRSGAWVLSVVSICRVEAQFPILGEGVARFRL